MTDPEGAEATTPSYTPLALLLGAAACVGCLAAVAYASAALLGVSIVPAALLGLSAETALVSGALLVGFAVYGARQRRKVREARERGDPPNPYWVFHPGRALASLVAGFAAVAAVALVAKAAVEAATDLTYTIHWVRTVPLLAVAFGWLIHGEWNRRLQERGPGAPS